MAQSGGHDFFSSGILSGRTLVCADRAFGFCHRIREALHGAVLIVAGPAWSGRRRAPSDTISCRVAAAALAVIFFDEGLR
jgi:hypothetical protein